MIFKDPIRTVQAEVPAGWVYDPFNSTLTDFVFSRWDQPQEMLAIHVRRASISSSRPDEEWVQKIRVETKGNATLTDAFSAQGRAVVAEFKSSRGWVQRIAFVRGSRVELVIEQRSTLQTEKDVWKPLEKAVSTAASDVNSDLPEDGGSVEFNESVKAVNQAFEKGDHREIEQALLKSIDVGTSAWLHSMAMPDRALEIDAAVRVAQAMVHLGLFSGEPSVVRNADFLLRRAQHSLEAAQIQADWAQELGKQISETQKRIWSEILESSESEDSEHMLPILSLRERGFRAAHAAAKAFELHDFDKAARMAEMAAHDLLPLIAFLRQNRTREIPEDIRAHLSEQGIVDEEQQIDAIQKAREALLFPPLNTAAQIRHCCALEQGDVEAAAEAYAVRAPLARQIMDLNPEDTGTALNLALAMMDCAGTAAIQTDSCKLDEASDSLDEAVRILGAIGIGQNGNDFWIHYHKDQTDAALRALDRGLAVAEQEKASLVAQGLSELRSRFQTIASMFQEAAATLFR